MKIFARFTKPHGSEAAPALLLLPDADDDGAELADYFAAKGYATLIPDYCGRRGGKGTGKVTKSDTAANEADAAKEDAAKAEEIAAEENTDGGKKNYTVYPEAADFAETAVLTDSSMVFHSPQSGHFPAHFADSNPQFEQM